MADARERQPERDGGNVPWSAERFDADRGGRWMSLGPLTEARFRQAFETATLLSAPDTAQLLSLDEKTLKALTRRGVIQACPLGRRFAYSEGALRDYLTNPPRKGSSHKDPEPCRFTNRRRAPSGSMTSSTKAVAFTALRASWASEKPKR
jgi:hypothetical protein